MEGLRPALLSAPGSCASRGAGPAPDPLTPEFPPEFSLAHAVLGCLNRLGMVTQLFWCWIWHGGWG